MKIIFNLFLTMLLAFSLCACGEKDTTDKAEENGSSVSGAVLPETEETEVNSENTTPITLTIGDTVLSGCLNNSAPAQSLISQLPLTVTLNDSDNDFCGGSLDLEYSDSDVQNGYKNGDLAFWPPAGNFVIFVDDEENSANTGNLVILGRITVSQEALDALKGRIDVTIALTGDNEISGETELPATDAIETDNIETGTTANESEVSELKVKITVGDTELTATMEDNATTRAIIEQMPMTLPMMDLYGREMCYRYGAYALPTDELRSDGYEVGDIAYWAPGGSLVILYAQNGEQFERQHLGHIDSGVEVFENTGDMDVTFEIVSD